MAYVLIGLVRKPEGSDYPPEIVLRTSTGNPRFLEIWWDDFMPEEGDCKLYEKDGIIYQLEGYRIEEVSSIY